MTREEALAVLATLDDESYQDDGAWTFGHDYSLTTGEGYYTMSNDVYDPVLGPHSLDEATLTVLRARYPDFDEPVDLDEATKATMKALFPDYEDIDREAEDLPLFDELEIMEQLIVKRGGRPNVQYYAFVSYEGERVDEMSFTEDEGEVDAWMKDTICEFGEFTPWEEVEDEELISMAQQILEHRGKDVPSQTGHDGGNSPQAPPSDTPPRLV